MNTDVTANANDTNDAPRFYENRTIPPEAKRSPNQKAAYTYVPADSGLPQLYSCESEPDPLIRVKLFTPTSSWTFYLIEFDGESGAFGLVRGHETELGYIDLDELSIERGPLGLPIERDIHFTPRRLSEVLEAIDNGRPL